MATSVASCPVGSGFAIASLDTSYLDRAGISVANGIGWSSGWAGIYRTSVEVVAAAAVTYFFDWPTSRGADFTVVAVHAGAGWFSRSLW